MKNSMPSIFPMRTKSIALAVYGIALATTMGIAYSQAPGPSDSKGVTVKNIATSGSASSSTMSPAAAAARGK